MKESKPALHKYRDLMRAKLLMRGLFLGGFFVVIGLVIVVIGLVTVLTGPRFLLPHGITEVGLGSVGVGVILRSMARTFFDG